MEKWDPALCRCNDTNMDVKASCAPDSVPLLSWFELLLCRYSTALTSAPGMARHLGM